MNYDAYAVWCKELDKRTDGRTSTILYGGGSLAVPRENWDAITSGMADMGEVWANLFPGRFPETELYMLPFVAPTAAIAAPSLWEMTNTHPELMDDWDRVKLIGQHTSAIQNLHTTADAGLVKTLEDMKGMVLGADNAAVIGWFTTFGAAIQQIDTQDAYLALEKGVIQGGVWPWAPLRSQKITEFCVNHTVIDLLFVVANQIMNKEKYEALPDDVKAALSEITGYSLSALGGYTLTNGSITDIDYMKNKGDTFYNLPPDEKARWRAMIEPTYGEWFDAARSRGIADPEGLWDDLMATVAKYSQDPYIEEEWWGLDGIGKVCSPNRPGGWSEEECPGQ
jgi:TRAP-type C4-dicarboxylate transport system substrate-binding protein